MTPMLKPCPPIVRVSSKIIFSFLVCLVNTDEFCDEEDTFTVVNENVMLKEHEELVTEDNDKQKSAMNIDRVQVKFNLLFLLFISM